MTDLRSELQAIYDQNGELTPALVRDTARPKDHPLHGAVFDRPIQDAAEEYYLSRARELIQSVKITYRKGDREEEVRYFVSVSREGGGYTYRPVEEVATDEVLSAIVLRDMERDWRQLQSRYGHFKEFAEIVRRDLTAA